MYKAEDIKESKFWQKVKNWKQFIQKNYLKYPRVNEDGEVLSSYLLE